jgi:hypothetical protein
MSGITLTQAQQQLSLWLEADAKTARGQSYTIDGRSMTRADANAITAKINYWQDMVNRLSGNQRRGVSRVVPF